ncbi:hypothetical protein GCM10022254_64080 [Actinomadura meridiana]|uniref:Uncharacterized protein n=1 Tax=Actinomadura meridiana TaxID=559626 RepID=A0ABP8CKG2_9ACTN
MQRRTGKRAAVRFVRYRPVPMTRGALALNPAPPPAQPPGLRLVRPAAGVDAEVRAVADTAIRLVLDILAGTRPAHQLSLVAAPAVCRELLGRTGALLRRGGRIVPPRVLTSRLQRPTPTVAEVTAVVIMAGRIHALALRLDHTRGRWRCTALETTAP